MAIISDTFTDANGTGILSHTADVGSGYTRHPSAFGTPNPTISSNTLAGDFNLFSAFYNNTAPGTANYKVCADVIVQSTSDSANGGGVVGRLDSGTTLNCYMVRLRSGTIVLSKYVSGALTNLGSVSYTLTLGTFYVELRMLGSTLEVFVQRLSNGNWINSSGTEVGSKVACISVTDGSITAEGFAGIVSRSVAYDFDNFLVDFAGVQFTEEVDSVLDLQSAFAKAAYRTPLIFTGNARVGRLPEGDFIKGVAPNGFIEVSVVDLDDLTYYYYGGTDSNGDWKINRYNRTTLAKTSATESNNGAYLTLAAAWADRTTLTYE